MPDTMHPGMAILWAYYPREPEPPESTIVVWSAALEEYELGDVVEAARLLGRVKMFLPSLKEFEDIIREIRNERLETEIVALPEPRKKYMTFRDWIGSNLPTPHEREVVAMCGLAKKVETIETTDAL